MGKFFIIAAALGAFIAPAFGADSCLSGWDGPFDDSKCYKFAEDCEDGDCTFSDARTACNEERPGKDSQLAQVSFDDCDSTTDTDNCEADYVLTLLDDTESDDNVAWLAAKRTCTDASCTTWEYTGSDPPSDFDDDDVSPKWGPGQPDDEDTNDDDTDCQCGLAMARYNSWDDRAFDDLMRSATGYALCQYEL